MRDVNYSDQQIDVYVEKWLLEAYGNFFKDFMKACMFEPEAGYLPVVVRIQQPRISFHIAHSLKIFQQFLDPVYGQKDTPYTEFMAPGLIIS
jgi:hypothetical protein